MIQDLASSTRSLQGRELIEDIASTYQDPEEVINWYYSEDNNQLMGIESRVLEDAVVEKLSGPSVGCRRSDCSYQDALPTYARGDPALRQNLGYKETIDGAWFRSG